MNRKKVNFNSTFPVFTLELNSQLFYHFWWNWNIYSPKNYRKKNQNNFIISPHSHFAALIKLFIQPCKLYICNLHITTTPRLLSTNLFWKNYTTLMQQTALCWSDHSLFSRFKSMKMFILKFVAEKTWSVWFNSN